jgi:hypothetical protein
MTFRFSQHAIADATAALDMAIRDTGFEINDFPARESYGSVSKWRIETRPTLRLCQILQGLYLRLVPFAFGGHRANTLYLTSCEASRQEVVLCFHRAPAFDPVAYFRQGDFMSLFAMLESLAEG